MTSDDAYVSAIEERRAKAQADLHGPHSALAAVARHELPVGSSLTFGPDEAADVRLAGIPRAIRVDALPDGFRVDGEPSGPRTVDAGRYALRLSHQRYPAIVILDRESPRLREDVSLRWYPIDPRMRVRARLEPDRGTAAIASTASPDRTAERAGWIAFTVDGIGCRAAIMRMLEPGVPDEHLDLYFRDATTGHDSYAVGRYVTVERDGGDVIVDFNSSYNPSCALSPYYNCPIPPRENHLPAAIRAGEMTPRDPSAVAHG